MNRPTDSISHFKELVGSFIYGFRMDIATTCYLIVPIIVLLIISCFKNSNLLKKIGIIYTFIIAIFLVILIFVDVYSYSDWGFRIDGTPLKYLLNPKEALASIGNKPIWLILFLISVILYFLWKGIKFLFEKYWIGFDGRFKFFNLIFLIFMLPISVIGMRGGLQLAPINQSSVYFSQYQFANIAAINAPWNFIRSLSKDDNQSENENLFLSNEIAKNTTDSLLRTNWNSNSILKNGVSKPNIIYIVWESYTAKVVDLKRENKEITPYFNRLKNEGIYFSNAFASGDRTDKGIVALLSGFPAQPTTSIVKAPQKTQKLPMISKQLSENGYQTNFYYGGELEFANMKSYLLGGNFQNLTDIHQFDKKDLNSKWGANDEVVARKMFNEIKSIQQPFFATWLTLTSHEPFEIPIAPLLSPDNDENLFLNSLHYTDSVVGNLIDSLKSLPSWNNTIVVISADHGHPMPKIGATYERFKIPILVLGGALQKNEIINFPVSQIDITPSLLSQMNYPVKEYTWSKNCFIENNSWAFFAFNNGFGFVDKSGFVVWDNVGKNVIEKSTKNEKQLVKYGQALQQKVSDDFISK